jgi:glutathione-independent formaldehyde dehydrogenase
MTFTIIIDETYVIVRITSSAICGSDLHMYDGRTGATPDLILGHEPMGLVDRMGNAVRRVSVGDRVVVPAAGAVWDANCVGCSVCRAHPVPFWGFRRVRSAAA